MDNCSAKIKYAVDLPGSLTQDDDGGGAIAHLLVLRPAQLNDGLRQANA